MVEEMGGGAGTVGGTREGRRQEGPGAWGSLGLSWASWDRSLGTAGWGPGALPGVPVLSCQVKVTTTTTACEVATWTARRDGCVRVRVGVASNVHPFGYSLYCTCCVYMAAPSSGPAGCPAAGCPELLARPAATLASRGSYLYIPR